MSGLLAGAVIGGLVGAWGAVQRNMAMNGGRMNLQGMDLVVIILGTAIAAIAGGAVGHGLAGLR
ncbi:conserved hypothetical protein [Hyphomicrobiales bacterium]|nr:conserved hypothetical protein [Hyphomicrobiales bacterium]CAH1697149.1 conserved hypothetical protein [Hyphomicrobiales bacterium]CAI0342717.1 conserved hypothetical protein [Hyphomicrobiales bacterium]